MRLSDWTWERQLEWPWPPVLLIALGLVLAGVPEHREGPTLFRVGAGHGFTVANAVAVVLLLTGGVFLSWGAWRQRSLLKRFAHARPVTLGLLLLQLGVGSWFLIVSGPSTILKWWAPGTVLSVAALIGFASTLTATARGSGRA